ncbi:catalase C [Aliirhizobium cellulosilyticum]|uniref:Catalase n=1 Tax=Aliirhizobium cellulosilyticum TaxID=393664 RepID=A0A7W6SDM9_9HYPH|nr:catalase C [Rhizobium cellulosilyticum]MBB4351133.1 catalase [Rhizobium cellulosilyticum]MBB4414291.1 catalase [Rhizobium cellulosilyticum]MBB4448907.1 catalase [Rhizobium cellulosilyticum]
MAKIPATASADPKFVTATIHDQKLTRGAGGELHQPADGDTPVMTTAQGGPVADDQNSLRVGPRGPLVVDDFHFREKMFHFDHERIPERVVHARGYGAHGYFETYESCAKYTRADFLQRPGEKTPAFVRFSTVAGNKGSADLARDVRGFAVKIYTKEGNWDLVGNNIPVFFIQDAIKFPDLIHAAKQEPDRAFPQAQTAHDNFWDFISLTPESMNMIMWIMSDRTIPRSLRFMEGFGVHTFRFINDKDESTFVKFHWKPKLGLQSVAWNEAVKINGADPDFHRRDLWNAIQSGNFPEWELQVQLFDEVFADSFDFDVLDPTKIIPEEILKPVPIGRLVLDRMPDNFFAETEQVAFMTQNVPPGIDFSNDPLLQGRNFSYLDTQLKRLGGPNFTHLPINAPKCPMHNFQQDGHMAMRNPVGRTNYQPNSHGEGPRESPTRGYRHFASEEQGTKARLRPESFADHYSQARQFYISQTGPEQRHIASALTFELSKVEALVIRERMVAHLLNIDETLATTVAQKLGFKTIPKPADAAMPTRQDLDPSPALSIVERGPERFEGRKLGILVTDGVDAKLLEGLTDAITAEKGVVELIASKVGGVTASDGMLVEAQHMIDGGPSVLFDAVALLTSAAAIEDIVNEAAARDFVADAFQHCKFIGYDPSALPLLAKAGVADALDEGILALPGQEGPSAFVAELGKLRVWSREPSVKLGKASPSAT